MCKKLRLAILFGGKSAEHEVSLQSAKSIIPAIDKNKYNVILIGIDKNGIWHLIESSKFLLYADNPGSFRLRDAGNNLTPATGENTILLVNQTTGQISCTVDVVFPVLHGPFGEDGTVQGLLKLANVPFVGAGVLGSAVSMDKDIMKRLFRDAGLPTAKFLVFDRPSFAGIDFDNIRNQLRMPVFVKPANLGSSVAISKVQSEAELDRAVKSAFEYDNKIVIEEYIHAREIECSVLGNDDPIASVPGEILPNDEFYSYKAKYIDQDGADFDIPAKLTDDVIKKIQDCAIKAFKTLCCQGMARVDFFLKDNKDVVINEVNTIPGFTEISMYPKLWQASGLVFPQLIDKLIQLAIERFDKEKELKTDFSEKFRAVSVQTDKKINH